MYNTYKAKDRIDDVLVTTIASTGVAVCLAIPFFGWLPLITYCTAIVVAAVVAKAALNRQ